MHNFSADFAKYFAGRCGVGFAIPIVTLIGRKNKQTYVYFQTIRGDAVKNLSAGIFIGNYEKKFKVLKRTLKCETTR